MAEMALHDEFSESFLQPVDRLAWSATKWEKYRGRDVIPLWIADMDFPVAPVIQQALAAHVAHGNFGYMSTPQGLADRLAGYYAERYGWEIQPEWIVWLPGLVLGFNLAVKACCAPGESALTFTPVYPPFLHAAKTQGRESIEVGLAMETDAAGRLGYHIDFAALEAAVCPSTRLLLLCHPHNPVGHVFSADELATLLEFAERHDLVVCSDEVHCDLILDPGVMHVPFARLMGERMGQSITLHGPGKVFNLAGLGISWAIIPDALLRRRYRQAMQRLVPEPCGLGYTALRAALDQGEPWRLALLARLRANRELVVAALGRMGLPHTFPAATYLVWIDARALVESVGNPSQWLEQHGVGLSDGADFGAPGFLRLNFGTAPSLLEKALARMEVALAAVRGQIIA